VVASPLPDFALRDQDGRLVRSAELRGKVTLLTFLDTQCTEACPIIASQIARTLDLLTPDERAQVAAIAISADPTGDTPASIRTFLRRNRAERHLRYLSGPEDRLRPIWEAAQVLPSIDTGDDDTHSAPVRVYGRDARWIATQHVGADLSQENLAHDIRLALSNSPTT
jgi:protein SCO1/2